MMLKECEARALTDKVLALSKADSMTVQLQGGEGCHIRYAQNMATTSGAPSEFSLSVTANFGTRSGTATCTSLSDLGMASVVERAEKIARLAPENPEFMPPLGPQKYAQGTAFSKETQRAESIELAGQIRPVLKAANAQNVQASGYLQTRTGFSAFATSAGLFVYDQTTNVSHTVTARTPDGTGAGWAGVGLQDIRQLNAAEHGRIAIEKAVRSKAPQPLSPGKYVVILEASAVCDLIGSMMDAFDQRAADEGRSFATKKGGGSRVGEQVFGKNIHLHSDPNDSAASGPIYSDDGLPATPVSWVENGLLKALPCSRYWAKKTNRSPIPSPTNILLEGGSTSIEEMVKQIDYGLWITRFWYVREVDPQTVLLTGLTRDGIFLIEKGKVSHSVQNFRFNQSPVEMLNNVLASGPSVRTYGSEMGGDSVRVPSLLVKDFTLSSVSDAV